MTDPARPKKTIHTPALLVLVVSLMMMMNGMGCLLVGPIFGLMAPGMGVAAWVEAEHHAALDERGIECPGQVLNAAEYYDSDGNRRVRVTYEWDCGAGPNSDEFTESYNENWPAGMRLTIEALPENHSKHRRQGETSEAAGMVAVGGLAGVLGACMCSLVALLLVAIGWSLKNLYKKED